MRKLQLVEGSLPACVGGLIVSVVVLADSGAQEGALQTERDANMVIARHPSLEPSEEFTLEFWAKPTSSPQNSEILLKDDGRGAGFGFVYQERYRHVRAWLTPAPELFDVMPTGGFNGSWQHFALTADTDRGFVRLYRNGVLRNAVPAPPRLAHGGDMIVGGNFNGYEFEGVIDEIRLWNWERTEQEIASNWNRRLDRGLGLVSVWHLDGDALDAVSSNHGVLQGGARFSPTGAPLLPYGFLSASEGLWTGGEWITIVLSAPISSGMPRVTFDGVPAPRVRLVDPRTVSLEVPPGEPGSRVEVQVVPEQGEPFLATSRYLYTPGLEARSYVERGRMLRFDARLGRPGVVFLMTGLPAPRGVRFPPLGGALDLSLPFITLTQSSVPLPSFSGGFRVPLDSELRDLQLPLQIFVGYDPGTLFGAFSNSKVVEIR